MGGVHVFRAPTRDQNGRRNGRSAPLPYGPDRVKLTKPPGSFEGEDRARRKGGDRLADLETARNGGEEQAGLRQLQALNQSFWNSRRPL
jgi:hypothetical protein